MAAREGSIRESFICYQGIKLGNEYNCELPREGVLVWDSVVAVPVAKPLSKISARSDTPLASAGNCSSGSCSGTPAQSSGPSN